MVLNIHKFQALEAEETAAYETLQEVRYDIKTAPNLVTLMRLEEAEQELLTLLHSLNIRKALVVRNKDYD